MTPFLAQNRRSGINVQYIFSFLTFLVYLGHEFGPRMSLSVHWKYGCEREVSQSFSSQEASREQS